MIVAPIAVAILFLSVTQAALAAETATNVSVAPAHHLTNTNIAEHHTHHLVPHHALTGQVHQYNQSIHAMIGSVQTQAAHINLANTQTTFYAQTNVNAITGSMAQANNNVILSNGSFANHHHNTASASQLATAVAQHSNLHHVPQLHHASLLGDSSQAQHLTNHQTEHNGSLANSLVVSLHHRTSQTKNHGEGMAQQSPRQASSKHEQSTGKGVESKHLAKSSSTKNESASPHLISHEYVPQVGLISTNEVAHSFHEGQIQISKVIKGDYTSWTGGKDKPLTLKTVGELLRNPHITGSQAAALGVIAQKLNGEYVSKRDRNVEFSYSQLKSLLHEGWQVANQKASHNEGASLTRNFMSATAQIASAHTEAGRISLYGVVGKPDSADIKQGAVNDCYFLSTVESLLNKDPKLISNMISENKDGSYTVKFANGQPEKVHLTDGAIAEFSLAKHNGAWLAILGMAEAQVRENNNTIKNDTPLGNTIDLGRQTQAMSLFTGITYEALSSKGGDWNSGTMTHLLNSAFASKQPIGVSSSDHALAILGWDPKTQEVTIKNPWGTSGKYTPESGSGQFVMEKNGIFKISLTDMLQMFRQVAAPATLIAQAQASQGTNIAHSGNSSAAPANAPTNLVATNVHAATGMHTHHILDQRSFFAHTNNAAQNHLRATSFSQPTAIPKLSTLTQSLASTNIDIAEIDIEELKEARSQDSGKLHLPTMSILNSSENHYDLHEGTFFLCSAHKTVIHDKRAEIQIAGGAAVFLVNLGSELAIYNFHDERAGSVRLKVGDKAAQDIPVGHAVIIASDSVGDAKQLLLPQFIGMAKLDSIACTGNQKVFTGLFSYAMAILNCPQLTQLRRSSGLSQQKLAATLMKTAAAVSTITFNKANQ